MDTKTNRSHQQQHTVLFWNTLTFVYNTGWAPSLNVSLTILPEGSCPSFFIFHWYTDLLGFPGDSGGKESPATRETWIQSLGWEEPLEKEMATHSSILAWITPWTEEPGRLQCMRLQRVRHDWARMHWSYSLCNLKDFFFGRSLCAACKILVPWRGIEPVPPALRVWSLSH